MASVESPLEIVLEFARAEATGDAHAFRFAPQSYVVRTPRGGFGASELAWNEELLAKLAAVRLSGQDPALLAELGELMRRFPRASGLGAARAAAHCGDAAATLRTRHHSLGGG